MNVKLLPYCNIDGIATFTDSEIMGLYQRTTDEGTCDMIFYDGSINSKEEFLSVMKYGQNELYTIIEDSIKGFVWLNRFEGKFARIHFCFFKEAWGDTVKLGKFVNSTLINMKASGEFILDMILGYIPISNQKAISYSKKIGGKEAGEIPCGSWNKHTKQSEPARILYYVRGL